MYTAFCFCCKKKITSLDSKEFRRSGHVETKEAARAVYQISTSKIHRNVR